MVCGSRIPLNPYDLRIRFDDAALGRRSICATSRRCPDCRHGSADRNDRPCRLFHSDEHGLAADLARRHSEQEVSRSGATSSATGTARRATCRPALRVLEAALAARTSAPTTSPSAIRRTSISSSARRRASWPSRRTIRSASPSRPASTRRFSAVQPACDQLALRARDVRPRQGQPVPQRLQGASSAAPAAGRFRRPTPGTS